MHNGGMRNHTDIIRAIGETAVAELTEAPVLTVRSWAQRDSIPSKHWVVLVGAGHCTAEDLMAAAAAKKAA
jgi:hypothetical protein